MSANLEVGKHSHNCCHGDGVRIDESIARYERMTEMAKAEYEKWKSKALSLEDLSSSAPYITMDGSNVVFNYFTPKQMAEAYMWLEGGNLWFELTKDEEGQYSLTTKSDIQELDGMFLVGGEEFIVNTIIDTLTIDLKGYKVNEVRIEGIDADLLDADFTWKLAEISNKLNDVAKESTSQEILEGVRGIRGDNQEATNSAIYDAINAISPDLVQGKERLATAITSKGVETTSADSLSQMAENVSSIAQESYTIDGGEMYAKQQFGDGFLYNLYQVLADMKTRFMGTGDYAALLVCEFYRGGDSLVLQGADGYYTCDGDYYDYSNPTHIWHDYSNGYANRWVCFLFQQEGANFDITNTAISPRSIYVGGHIGTITQFVNGCLTQIVGLIEETDIIDKYEHGTYTNNWERTCVMNGVQQWEGTIPCERNNNIEVFVARGTKKINVTANGVGNSLSTAMRAFYAPDIEEISTTHPSFSSQLLRSVNSLEICDLRSLKKLQHANNQLQEIWLGEKTKLIDVIVGALENNFKAGWGGSFGYWNPTAILSNATAKAQLIENVKNHILARVSDRTGLSQLVFTVSTNMYNEIASEQIEWQGETMTLADAFLTKNWLLAGA